jgi:hypothetical protein
VGGAGSVGLGPLSKFGQRPGSYGARFRVVDHQYLAARVADGEFFAPERERADLGVAPTTRHGSRAASNGRYQKSPTSRTDQAATSDMRKH